MKRISSLFLAFVILSLSSMYAQEKGFYGKNTFIQLGMNGQLPVFANVFRSEQGYVAKGNGLKKSYNLIDYGFRISLGAVTSESSAIAFELNQRFYQVDLIRKDEMNRQYIDGSGNQAEEYKSVKMQFMPLSETVFMPKILFSANSERVPAGFNHEIGLGYSIIQLDNKLRFELPFSDSMSVQTVSNHLIDSRVEDLRGLNLMYGFSMNYPLSKSILFNIGFRYQYATLLGKKKFRTYEQTEDWISGRELWSRINERRQLGIISFGTGFTFCF